jgi:tetratricopeptide (TPR) repeat protein
MKSKEFLLVLFVFISAFISAQDDNKEKAHELGHRAIELMDEGKLDESLELLEQAKTLDPENISYTYEIAYANYLKKNYQMSIELLSALIDHKDASDIYYQLLGNAYDLIGEPNKALEIYAKGMDRFPKSGKFHLESGQIKYANEEYDEAIAFWEEGIKVNPNYSSNYYRLSKIFSLTDERIWTLLYGEYFILLEPNTKRTEEISKLLYENYQKSYEPETDTSGEFRLTKKGFELVIKDKKDLKDAKKGILPFEGTYAMTFSISAINFTNNINLESIFTTRNNFLDFWFTEKRFDKVYPNKLLSYQKDTKENNHFEAYTYWMLSQGNQTEFEEWYAKNENRFNDFVDWFNKNRIEINENDKNSRRDYQ